MRVLLAEYTTFQGTDLADEGRAMLASLEGSFERSGHEVILPEGVDFGVEIARLAPECEAGLVIAPDHLLASFTRILEERTRNLGCGSLNVAFCANKVKTGQILSSYGIMVPPRLKRGPRVIKPIMGCGAQGVRISEGDEGEGEFGEAYIEGEHLSVSLVGGRVVGEACLYHTGEPPLVIAVNRQEIRINEGRFEYMGGETPVYPDRYDEIVSEARKAATILGCQGYAGIDVVVADRVYVVDVNPRITTSVVGIVQVMEEELGKILIDASYGRLPDAVHLSGHVKFTKDGRIVT
ncbi:MAG: ATP-grasp domain-containing protein [Methanomicrobiales archaeon]|nr:ATP-grasp domain-containing protein [Methanomicrobiales archaeon]